MVEIGRVDLHIGAYIAVLYRREQRGKRAEAVQRFPLKEKQLVPRPCGQLRSAADKTAGLVRIRHCADRRAVFVQVGRLQVVEYRHDVDVAFLIGLAAAVAAL